jgi:hypothetical protein
VAEWQTRRSQKPLSERVCGFDSHPGHHLSSRKNALSRGRSAHLPLAALVTIANGTVPEVVGGGDLDGPRYFVMEIEGREDGVTGSRAVQSARNECGEPAPEPCRVARPRLIRSTRCPDYLGPRAPDHSPSSRWTSGALTEAEVPWLCLPEYQACIVFLRAELEVEMELDYAGDKDSAIRPRNGEGLRPTARSAKVERSKGVVVE